MDRENGIVYLSGAEVVATGFPASFPESALPQYRAAASLLLARAQDTLRGVSDETRSQLEPEVEVVRGVVAGLDIALSEIQVTREAESFLHQDGAEDL